MRLRRLLCCCFVLLLLLPVLRAQDAGFSQFFTNPTIINPALTGLFNGRYRVALNHRSQWGQVLESSFQTSAFAADFHYDLRPKRRTSDAFGGGVFFLNDRIAEAGASTNQVMVAAAFHKSLDARGTSLLSIGLQGGVVQRSVGYGDLTFADAFDGISGFIPMGSRELLPENSLAFGDYQLGVNYSLTPRLRRRLGLTVGVALHHLTAPEQSFYADLTAGTPEEVTNTLHRRYSGYANVRIPMGRNATLSPRLYVLQQGPHAVAQLGSTVRLPVQENSSGAIHFGGWVRVVQNAAGPRPESLTGLIGLEVDAFLFGLSYDATIHPLAVSGRHRGAFELSVSYTGQGDQDEDVPCPKF